MKTKQKNILLYALLGVVVIVIALFAKTNLRKNVEFQFKGETTSVSKQSQFTVDVYLDNKNGNEVTAYDIQLDYDKTKAKLVSAESAGYLTNPLIIKWDIDSAWFAASANPTSYKDTVSRTDPEKPVLTLTFIALDETNSSSISLKDTSEVYVSQKGGMSPSKAQFRFTVK
jgi:hypothetical protein